MNRNSPLHCAILAGNVDAVHILLEAGASVDLQNAKVTTNVLFSSHMCRVTTDGSYFSSYDSYCLTNTIAY